MVGAPRAEALKVQTTVAFSFSQLQGSPHAALIEASLSGRASPVATSITLSATTLSFSSLGATQQLSATVKDQNGATMASATVTWATSDPAVVTVSSTGLVTSIADGTATITATSGSATGTAAVTVGQVAATLSLSDSTLTFASLADTTQLTATVTDANGETISGATVTWATSDAAVATVSSSGLVTSIADGTATITATSGSATGTAAVTVGQVAASIALADTVLTFTLLADTTQLSATVKDAGGATMSGATVTWATSDAAVATVSDAGLVTAISPGTATITATHLTLSATASVVAEDGTFPEVLAFAVDTTGMSGGAMNNAETGILEFWGTIKLEAIVADNHQLQAIAFIYGDSILYEADLTGDSAYVSFDWNTRETSTVGGLADDTLGVVVIDMSDNVSAGLISAATSGKDGGLVLMHQPNVVVNNLLTRPVTATFRSKDSGSTYSTNTVAAQGSRSLSARVLSTDSVRLHWEIQREQRPGVSSGYLGQEFGAYFPQRAADVDLHERRQRRD